MAELEVRLLGPLEIRVAGQPAGDLAYQVAPLLVALLVAEPGRRWSRAVLASALFPDAPEETGRHRLREVLFRIRKAIGDAEQPLPAIAGSRTELWATGAADVDL